MKNDAYQGNQKIKNWWSETEYVVVHQVTDGVPAYDVKDEVGNVKTIHRNWLFFVATLKEAIMPLGAGMPISDENIIQSTRVEHTSLEVENDSPEASMDGADTLSHASRVPLRWVGGVLQPLPSPAGGTSEPCSHIPDTRCYNGGGGTMAVMGTFIPGPYRWER